MKPFLFYSIFLCILIHLSSCEQKTKVIEHKGEVAFFDPVELGATNQTSNLSIKATFDECGEWGGHKEKITVFADSTMSFFANYKVFPFNCDSLDYYYTNQNLKPTMEKTVVLDDKDKRSVSDYLQRLIQSKIAARFPGHAGNMFSAVNSDSTLVIQVYTGDESTVKSYRKLVAELFQ